MRQAAYICQVNFQVTDGSQLKVVEKENLRLVWWNMTVPNNTILQTKPLKPVPYNTRINITENSALCFSMYRVAFCEKNLSANQFLHFVSKAKGECVGKHTMGV